MGILDILGQPTDSIWGMINRLPSLFSQQEPPKRIDQPRHDKSAMYPPPKQQMQAPQQMQAQQLGLWDLIKDKASAMFGSEQPSPQQQQYESARMNRPPLSPPPMQQQMQAQMQQQQQMQAQQQMQQQQQQQMQMPKRRSLEEVTQTAQVQPALSPFPWLREVSGSYSHPSPPVGRWV